jgi:hypothetical protein
MTDTEFELNFYLGTRLEKLRELFRRYERDEIEEDFFQKGAAKIIVGWGAERIAHLIVYKKEGDKKNPTPGA